jgi:hypothetical protein
MGHGEQGDRGREEERLGTGQEDEQELVAKGRPERRPLHRIALAVQTIRGRSPGRSHSSPAERRRKPQQIEQQPEPQQIQQQGPEPLGEQPEPQWQPQELQPAELEQPIEKQPPPEQQPAIARPSRN